VNERWKADKPNNLCCTKADGKKGNGHHFPAARSAKPGSGGVNGALIDLPDSGNCPDVLWITHEVSLLAKLPNAKLVKDFRPIAVLPVIYKLYSRVMYMLAENSCDRLYAPQFAFRKFHQAHEVVFILRQLIERKGGRVEGPRGVHHGRGHQEGLRLRVTRLVRRGSKKRRIARGLDPCMVTRMENMKSVFKLDLQTTSKEVERTRSFPQGDPAAPMILNLVLDTIAETFIKTALQKGWGKQLQDGSWVNLIMFADNYWLVAASAKMLT
jgi:hypothetical protein